MTAFHLYNKLTALPENLRKEVEDFIDFLSQKKKKQVKKKKPVFGSFKGKIVLGPDFDEPLEDFKEYM